MKKTFIYIALISAFSVILFHSCEDEDTIRFNIKEFGQGFLPFFDWGEDSELGYDLNNINSSSITIYVDLRAQETENLAAPANDISEIGIKVTYGHVVDSLEIKDAGIVATTNTWPSEITITPQDIVDVLDSIPSIADIRSGDKFTFTQRIVMKDGRIIDGIKGQDTVAVYDSAGNLIGDLIYDIYDNDLQINESGKNAYDLTVIANNATNYDGNYTLITTGKAGEVINNITDYTTEMQVTLTTVGPGVYECNACLGGVMKDFYGAFGGDLVTGSFVVLSDNTVQPYDINDGWNPITTYSGAYNPATGQISVDWTSDFGDNGTAIFTPNN